MKKTVGASLILCSLLLSGCSTQGIGNLAVHEALFYGGSQDRIAWVYGTLDASNTGGSSSVKLGDTSLTLRSQISGDTLSLPGTLSVDGKAVYRGRTGTLPARINVLRTGTSYSVQALGDVSAVYLSDGGSWSKLTGPVSAGQTVLAGATPNTTLRGAGDLTDAEADALAGQLKGQGTLAVAVLPTSSLPDVALKTEPALTDANRKLTGLYVQAGVNSAGGSVGTVGTGTTDSSNPAGARLLAAGSNATARSFQVVVARDAASLGNVSGAGLRQPDPGGQPAQPGSGPQRGGRVPGKSAHRRLQPVAGLGADRGRGCCNWA